MRPASGLLSAAGWAVTSVLLTGALLPPNPGYRTAVVGTAVLLFAAALTVPRLAFRLALVAASVAGISALAFGSPEPLGAAPIAVAGYLAGAALAEIYDIRHPPARGMLVGPFRAWVAASAVSAAAAIVNARSGWALLHEVPLPRTLNALGEDAAPTIAGTIACLASLLVGAGMHRAALRLARDPGGRRAVDSALVWAAVCAGGVGLLQRLGVLPLLRAARWQEWGRAQATFTDPSAAGVAAALLLAPLMARAAAGPLHRRVGAVLGVPLLLLVLADAGSRAGLIGALTAGTLFVLWDLTRLAAGARPGLRHKVASAVGGLAIASALVFAAALSWPGRGAERSVLLTRIGTTFVKQPTPAEKTGERLLLYEGALWLFQQHPVVGSGLGSFRAEFPNVARDVLLRPARFSDHPPSLYLGSLAESGLAGSLLLALLLAGLLRGIGGALTLHEGEPEEALRAAGAAVALVGLLVVFLFGSHLVYTEICVLFGVLASRLPPGPFAEREPLPAPAGGRFTGLPQQDGRTARFLSAVVPVATAGALVLLFFGVAARVYETRTPQAAFAYGATLGVHPEEREPDGRRFRWTAASAAWRLGASTEAGPAARPKPALLTLPVRNARPDGAPVEVTVFWNDADRGKVLLPSGGWYRLEMGVVTPGVLQLVPSARFRPGRHDRRTLGIEVGPAPSLIPRRPGG